MLPRKFPFTDHAELHNICMFKCLILQFLELEHAYHAKIHHILDYLRVPMPNTARWGGTKLCNCQFGNSNGKSNGVQLLLNSYRSTEKNFIFDREEFFC